MPDPGQPAGHTDPRVAQVLYALRDLGVEGQAVAVDALNAVGGARLTEAQTAAVLAAFGQPAGDPMEQHRDLAADREHTPDWAFDG